MNPAKNFSGQNLQGCSFKGQDLAGANFSNADIRGANFTNANLEGANFENAKAGLQRKWKIGLFFLVVFLVIIAGAMAASDVYHTVKHLIPKWNRDVSVLTSSINLLINIVFWLAIMQRGMAKAFEAIAVFLALAASIIVCLSVISNNPYLPWLKHLRVYSFMEALSMADSKSPIANLAVSLFLCLTTAIATVTALSLSFILVELIGLKKLGRLILYVVFSIVTFGLGNSMRILLRSSKHLLASSSQEFLIKCLFISIAILLAVLLIILSYNIAQKVLAEDKKYITIRQLGIAIATFGGTNFRNANLTDASFSYATLACSDFRNAIALKTNWRTAKNLEWTRLVNTILIDPNVRDLLVTGDGKKNSYIGANMKGANLIGVNLSDANLKAADLSQSLLQYACLEGANLTQVQAIGTNFANAKLTDAYGLGTWNIDSTTNLEGVDCQWVYLLEYPQPQTRNRERRPSSGEFGEGEFTKLFQEVLSTVDLIFRNGIDWKAFTYSFKQVQVENENTELIIQSIENKGDGVVVVRVNVPPDANKAKIHGEFAQTYDEAVQALEAHYQEKLQGKNAEINQFRQQNANMMEVVTLLASREVRVSESQSPNQRQSLSGKLVILKLGTGNVNSGVPVTLQISTNGALPATELSGTLPPAPELSQTYRQWQGNYHNLDTPQRIKVPQNQKTNISPIEDCQKSAKIFRENLNHWLNSESFRPLKELLYRKLDPTEEIRAIIQVEDSQLRRLPWQLWDFFENYRQAEIGLSVPHYDRVEASRADKLRTTVRILAILGNSTGIDIQKDRKLLEQLPNAEITFLVEPKRREIDIQLWDETGWDILFFAGHSSGHGEKGCISINSRDIIEVDQIFQALKAAVDRGLKLAIFNSCDGLELARELADLQIPQTIVMREPVPDAIAEAFLQNFINAYAKGKSLYASVREARERLVAFEDDYPCASWLPVICQHPAEIPYTWQQLRGVSGVELPGNELLEFLARLQEAIATLPNLQPIQKADAIEQIQILIKAAKTPPFEFQQAGARKAIVFLRGTIACLPATTTKISETEELLNVISQQFQIG